MFWEIFLKLCEQVKKTPNGVAKEISVSSGAVTSWKNGKVPHHSTLIKIANYFDVSLDYLLTGSESKEKVLHRAEELNDMQKKLIALFDMLNTEGQGKLLDYADDLVNSGKYKKDGEIHLGNKAI